MTTKTYASHVQTCFDKEEAHADAIAALTTIAAVDSYNINVGWTP